MLTEPETFLSQVTIQGEESSQNFDYAALAMGTSIEMHDLTVKDVYVTEDADSSSFGALTLTCEQAGHTIDVRTVPLYGSDGKLITADFFVGKTIDIKGIVDLYDGQYQVKVFTLNSITLYD